MALKINFETYGDETVYVPQKPTFVLMTRGGEKLGMISAMDEHVKTCMNAADEISFSVQRESDFAKKFYSQPRPPYHVGDIYYSNNNDNAVVGFAITGKAVVGREIDAYNASATYICTNERLSGDFSVNDWKPATTADVNVWDNLTNYKLLWCKEWNKLFEIYVEVHDGDSITKFITGTSLGEAELGQINLYGIQINTEDDISRDDYEPTVFYNPTNPKASLLHRITEKAPHYAFGDIDLSIRSIQRTFTFDSKSLYDSLQEIATEINCIFKIDCYLDENMQIVRKINAYDLESVCNVCGYRGDFLDKCPKCGSVAVTNGYGNDTGIFVSVDNLTDEITFSTDTGSVKNCFRLVAGDDLMTAAIRGINPNGSDYIYYISDDMKSDMSTELVSSLNSYDELYDYYYNSSTYDTSSFRDTYNNLVTKYDTAYGVDYPTLQNSLVGYPELTEAYYYAQDFYYYLSDSLMPTASMQNTTAAIEAAKLTVANLSPVAVADLSTISTATAESAVLGMAKVLVDTRYKVTATTTSYSNKVWRGNFVVTNYSDDEDTATSATINVTINGDYETYVKQKIDKAMNRRMMETDGTIDIISLFKLGLANFKLELKKYSLAMLEGFHDSGQTIIDILVEQGIANDVSWASEEDDLYDNLYIPYRNKLIAIDAEIKTRSNEISTVETVINRLQDEIIRIQDELNLQDYLGQSLWMEFVSFRREDEYKNDNYISDGLSNSEIIKNAMEFVEVAQKEIVRSATMQHQISATLSNFLVMEEFQPLVDYFETGNWIRCKVDDKVYKLRLLDYAIEYSNIEKLPVTFSDVTNASSGINDLAQVLEQAKSVSTSYSSVQRQASKGNDSNKKLQGWSLSGLSLTTMKIVNAADQQNITWDERGILARRYDDVSTGYEDKQLKIINNGLYVTDNNWVTSKAGIGEFVVYNPVTQQNENHYGVIADYLVGYYFLGENMGIFNGDASILINDNGISVTGTKNTVSINPNATNLLNVKKGNSQLLYLDNSGNLHVNGDITATSLTLGSGVTIPYSSISEKPDLSVFVAKDGKIGSTPAEGATGFIVSSAGLLQASNAIIWGTLYSSAGLIAGWTIGSNAIYKNTNSMTSTTAGTYIGTDGIRQYKSASAYVNIKDGVVTAKGASISGAITATSLSLGSGVTIPYSSVSGKPDLTVYIKQDGKVGSTPAEGATGFVVSSAGLLQASNAIIWGKLISSEGTIGGWTIGSSAIYKNTNSMTSTTAGTYIGTDGIRQYKSTTAYVNIQNGVVTAKGVDVSGTITSSNGTIGGWTIGSSAIYKNTNSMTSTTAGTYIGTDGIRQYKSTTAYVNIQNGVVTAKGVDVSGTITSSNGTIGGWTIGGSAIYHGTNSMTSTTAGTYIGTDGIRQYKSASALVNIQDGIVTAKGASISGTITATKLITGTKTASTTGKGTCIDSNGAIYCGDGSSNLFTVAADGKITCTGGTIGGWTITTNAIYSGTNSSTSTTAGLYLGTAAIRGYTDSTHFFTFSKGTISATGATIKGALTATTLSTGTKTNSTTGKGTYIASSGAIYCGDGENNLFTVAADGKIKSTGGTIGGWTITTNAIYKGTDSSSSTTAGLYLGTSAIRGYTDETHYFTFSKGTISATGATIKGALTATTLSTGTKTNSTTGKGTYIASSGAIYCGDGSTNLFTVAADGKITCTGGKIGGWTIGSSAIYNGTNSMSSTTAGTYIGTGGIRQYGSSSAYVNIKDGVVTAIGADIKGKINATSLTLSNNAYVNGRVVTSNITATGGTIGGWVVDTNMLYAYTNNNNNLFLLCNGTDGYNNIMYVRLTDGSGNYVYPFYLKTDGTMYASNLTIGGGDIGLVGTSASDAKLRLTYGNFKTTLAAWGIGVYYGNYTAAAVGESTSGSGYAMFYPASSSTPSITLQGSAGTVTCVKCTQTSDRRAKTDIQQLDRTKSKELINALKPSKFRYSQFNDGEHKGFIAQDVEKAIEDVYGDSRWKVVTTPNPEDRDEHNRFKSLAYSEFIADLVATAQLQDETITKLTERIERLEKLLG